MKQRILLIDDSETIQAAISGALAGHDYLLTTALTGAEGLTQIRQQHFDLVLLDYGLPDTNGLSLLQDILREYPDLPVMIVTGSGSERIAVDALKNGAADYVTKSDSFVSTLPHTIHDTMEKWEMKRRNRDLEGQLRESYKKLKQLNAELEEKVQGRTEELERAYQLSNELMAKAVDSNMQLAELYSEVDESRRKMGTKIRELTFLNEIGQTIAATVDRDTLLQLMIDAVYQELEIEHCAILLLDDTQQHLRIGASRGTPDDLLLAARALDGEQFLLDVLHIGQAVLVQDVESDPRLARLVADYPGVECCLLLPLQAKNLAMGIVTIYGYGHRKTLTNDDAAFVTSLACQMSIALANIRLTNQRIQEEQVDVIRKMAVFFMQRVTSALETMRTRMAKIQANESDLAGKQAAVAQMLNEMTHLHTVIADLWDVIVKPPNHGEDVLQRILSYILAIT
jgi:CheY-like chemotaxis protein